jgi:hypothetical protein
MYVCTTDEMTVTFSSIVPSLWTPSLCKTIVVPYVDINVKVTNFFPFCTIGISMYQNSYFTLFFFSLLSHPKLLPLWSVTDRQKDRFQHPLLPKFFFFSTERAGPYPQAQLYWAGRTMGWMADWTRSILLEYPGVRGISLFLQGTIITTYESGNNRRRTS